MKKAKLLLWTLALVMISCTPSNEEKAEKLMQQTVKEYLYHPKSYEPISTRVDSMFIDVTAIEPIMGNSKEIIKLIEKIQRTESDINSAETEMDIWAPDGFSTHYSRGQYARAKKEKKEAKVSLAKYTKKLSEQLDSLKKNVAQFRKEEFTGWIIFHRFNSLDATGTTNIPGEMVFFCNKELTACLGYESYKINKFLKILEEVVKTDSNEELIEFFKEERFSL